jgi:hypothetical protein
VQTATAHAPDEQEAVPFATLHALLHAPQFKASPVSDTSQPFTADESQSAYPVAQLATAHAPDEQAAVPFATLHALPHAPQFKASPASDTSQPFTADESQSA